MSKDQAPNCPKAKSTDLPPNNSLFFQLLPGSSLLHKTPSILSFVPISEEPSLLENPKEIIYRTKKAHPLPLTGTRSKYQLETNRLQWEFHENKPSRWEYTRTWERIFLDQTTKSQFTSPSLSQWEPDTNKRVKIFLLARKLYLKSGHYENIKFNHNHGKNLNSKYESIKSVVFKHDVGKKT